MPGHAEGPGPRSGAWPFTDRRRDGRSRLPCSAIGLLLGPPVLVVPGLAVGRLLGTIAGRGPAAGSLGGRGRGRDDWGRTLRRSLSRGPWSVVSRLGPLGGGVQAQVQLHTVATLTGTSAPLYETLAVVS